MDSKALLVSLLGHAILLGFLCYNFSEVIRPAGKRDDGFIAISMVTGDGFRSLDSKLPTPLWGGPQSGVSSSPRRALDPPSSSAGLRSRFSPNSLTPSPQSSTSGGEGGTSEILRQIRSKIERNKFYPLMASRQRIEGSAIVELKIKNDGSLEYVWLKQSSGSEILDEAAQKTVRSASPLPFLPQPIEMTINYPLSKASVTK